MASERQPPSTASSDDNGSSTEPQDQYMWANGPLWLPTDDGLLRPFGDNQRRFVVRVLVASRHRFMVGPMSDIEYRGQHGRVHTRQLCGRSSIGPAACADQQVCTPSTNHASLARDLIDTRDGASS